MQKRLVIFQKAFQAKEMENAFVVERRQPIGMSDTIFLNMLQMKVKSYRFEV